MQPEPIELVLLPERPAVPDDAATELDLVIEIRCRTSADPERTAPTVPLKMNLCLVIDRSSSMSGAKIETAKRSSLDIAGRLAPDDLFTVVVFNQGAEVIVNPQTPREQLAERIAAIEAQGSTNLSEGWHLGLLELQTHMTEDYYNRLFLLTDGQANAGETRVTALARDSARSRDLGVTTTAIGIGEDFNEDILEALASSSGGRFWYIGESRIEEILDEEFRGALSVLLDRPRVELTLPDGVTVARELNDLRRLGGRYRLRPLKGEDTLTFAVRLAVDPKTVDAPEFTVGARLFDADKGLVDQTTTVALLPNAQVVTTSSNPLVRSAVEEYELMATGEAMLDDMGYGDLDAIWGTCEPRMRAYGRTAGRVREFFGEDDERARLELEHLTMDLRMSEASMLLVELLEPFAADPLVRDFVASNWRKSWRHEFGRLGHKSVTGFDEDVVVLLLTEAVALANRLALNYPDRASEIRQAQERLREYLARLH